MRVYLPATLPGLARVLDVGRLGPPPLTGYAVTPALREWYADGGTEELEYAAVAAAARASLRLLAGEPDALPRRVVLAAEVADQDVSSVLDPGTLGTDESRALVRVTISVLLSSVASGHVDDAVAESDIRAARDALEAADAGDEDAKFTVDGAEGHELMWYATQELRYLLSEA